MKRLANALKFLIALVILEFATSCVPAGDGNYGYDPKADAVARYHEALADARTHGKRVLVIAGGSWCRYCIELNSYLEDNPDIESALQKSFVILKVYYGDANYNRKFFSRLSQGNGYPHLWVLDSDGGEIFSTSITYLENGTNAFDRSYFLQFADEYGGGQNN